MTEFQEDMLFKNVSEEDIQILLEILEKESESANIWTKELRLLDPTTYKPDLIIELDDENTEKVMELVSMLEDIDDVQAVYHNLDI